MAKDIGKIWVYRMIHFKNLDYILQNGIYSRNSKKFDPAYINIGSNAIIEHRDKIAVKCYPNTMVNEYIPFYFGVRTPMLYKIKTGHGITKVPQDEILYLVCKFDDIANSGLIWCFTDGNAAQYISCFYKSVIDIDKLDWRSIHAEEWTDNNSDGDHDRMRKKHSEFLVKDHLPVEFIKGIVVQSENRGLEVKKLIEKYDLDIKVHVDNVFKFYYR